MLKFFRLPFATTGDKTAVPDAVDSNGNVSYSQGYGFDYQRQKTDPAAKNIERDKMNQVFFDITTAIAELQAQGAPDYITSALNGGTAYSYGQYAIVKYSGDLYISLVAANTALPSDATKWALLPTPARLQAAFNSSAVAGGTVDAITAAFTPAIAALPAAPGTLSVFVRAGGANATTTPTFKADGTTAKTIVKGANQALVAGDIAGAGHWLELQYDATLDKWVLQNPAYGVAVTGQGNFAGLGLYNASATLSASDVGKLIAFYGSTAAQTLTLPAVAGVPVGKNFVLVNQASTPVTIKGNAAENISVNRLGVGQTLSNTLVLNPGDSITLSSNGGSQWNAYGMAQPFYEYMLVRDEKASGTTGGASTIGVLTRTLNTTVANTINGASLASNQVTLPAGTYRVRATIPAYSLDRVKGWLYNVTDSTFAAIGDGGDAATYGDARSIITGRFTIAATKVFELRMNSVNPVTDGLGLPASAAGVVEVYSVLEITKES